ncbi:MAG: cadherin-like beta sandwich domain-containing protein [Chitinophagaceae bacterium]
MKKNLLYIFSLIIILMIILQSCKQDTNSVNEQISKEEKNSNPAKGINKKIQYANSVNKNSNTKQGKTIHIPDSKPAYASKQQKNDSKHKEHDIYLTAPFNNIIERQKYEFDLIKDPATGKIPDGVIQRSYLQGKSLPGKESIFGRTANLNTYTSAGPDNLGGRTRAFAYDVRFLTNQVMIAGSVSSGVMRSTNGGTSWTLVAGTNNIHDITCIAQDPRPGQQDTWYLGTGESLGNSSSATGAFRTGFGVYKSNDNGLSWNRLTLSNTSAYESFSSSRDLIQRIVVDPTNGNVYAACLSDIARSTDGGNNWTSVLTAGFGSSRDVCDIVCSNTGVLYAGFAGTTAIGDSNGVWTSTTGASGSWTKIAGNGIPSGWKTSGTYGRLVLALAPNNQNVLYALYDNKLTGTTAPHADFFRYSANTGSGTWSANLTNNLPNEGGLTGTFDTQGGYDIVVEVKPNDSNFVIIGGTNAYTSTDGFATPTSFKRIGGYAVPTSFASYPNHHPDIHAFAFEPGSNIKMVSGDDGGIHVTNDVTAATVSWASFNNSYQTYQYYFTAIDPTQGSTRFIGGAQDNGTTYRNAGTNTMLQVLGGDGVSVGISQGNVFHYAGFQLGDIFRRASGLPPNFGTAIKPAALGTAQGLFITLFYLNPDNTEDLYYANANTLWRTTVASTVTPSVGWTEMTGVSTAVTGNIRSFATTRRAYNPTHNLYIGTSGAKIFRLTDPRNAAPATVPADITPSGITAGSTVIGIAVAPDNDDTVMAVISNYNAVSIFWTGNATAATPVWYNVEGTGANLLSLPSFRSCAIVKKGTAFEYYVGTSVGLYSTTLIDGKSQATANNTSWVREGTGVIDQAVVTSLPIRNNDNTLLVGTHGNGMYYSTIGVIPLAPTVITNPATAITSTSAILNGTVNDNDATTTVSFDYGTSPTLAGSTNITATTGGTITNGTGATAVAAALAGLTPGTVYYFRVKAVNSVGTTFGSILSFTTLTRASSSNADLSNLTISAGTLTLAFAPGTTSYTASVSNGTTSITVTPTTGDATATVRVNGVVVPSGTPSAAIPLIVGNNIIIIVVTAQDGTTTKTYTITVTRAFPTTIISDFFRSKQSGNWNDVATWESSPDNVNWINATLTPDFNANTITIRSPHSVTITANITIDQTVINSGGVVVVNPNIVLTINDGAGTDVAINSGGNLTLRSTATGTAMIGNSAGIVSGDVTVERFISAAFARSAWRLLTTPLRSTTGTNVSIFNTWQNAGLNTAGRGTRVTGPGGLNGLDAVTVGASMKWFDGSALQNVTTTNNPAITPLFTTALSAANKSFFIFIDGDRNATAGSPNTTTLSATGNLQMGDQTFTTSAITDGFELIGNPYASPVDLDLFRQNNIASNIKTTYYYWDPYLTGTFGYGGYVTVSYDGTGTSYTITPAGADHTRFLQSGQAMFVQTKKPATGAASVTFKETQKSTTNVNNIFRTQSGNIESLGINLNVVSSGSPVLVDGIIAKFDYSYAAAIDNYDAAKLYNVGEGIAFIIDNKALSIDRRPMIKSEDILLLNLANLRTNRAYQFEINPDFNAPLFSAWLKDDYLNTIIPIDVNKITTVNFTVNNNAASTGANRFSIVFSKPPIVQAGKPGMSLFPNPVVNGVIKIKFNNMPQGLYKVRVLNNLGQTVLSKQIYHATGNSIEVIELGKKIKGVYHLEVIRPDNSKFSTTIIAD